jgi:hypothetical protein
LVQTGDYHQHMPSMRTSPEVQNGRITRLLENYDYLCVPILDANLVDQTSFKTEPEQHKCQQKIPTSSSVQPLLPPSAQPQLFSHLKFTKSR